MRTAIRRRHASARSDREVCPIRHLLYRGKYGAVHDVLNTPVVYDVLNTNNYLLTQEGTIYRAEIARMTFSNIRDQLHTKHIA